MDLYISYKKQIMEDLKFDAFNIKEYSMLVASKKHFWVARLNDHRLELEELKTNKNKLIKTLLKKAEEASPIKLSKVNLEKSLEDTPEFEDINKKIKENEHLIKYLEDVGWIFSKLTEDIKNAIENIKLEQM
jgi:hypothetical protein